MRRTILATVLVLVAQDAAPADPEWTISAFGLMNRTHIRSIEIDWYTGATSATGLKYSQGHRGGGLSLERPVSSRWSLRFSPVVTSRGFDHRHRSTTSLVFRYFDTAILSQWAVLDRKAGRLYAFGGPRLGYRLTDTQQDVYVLIGLSRLYSERAVNWGRWDVGLEVGLGAEVRAGGGGLFVNGSYIHGLMDVYSDPPQETQVSDYDDKWRTLEIKAGLSVRFGSR